MASRSVESDIGNSRKAFTELVWPEIQDKWFDGAELEPVEDESDSLKYAMDTISGVDYWTVGDELIPLASRVQNGPDYSTWSIRTSRNTQGSGNETEFQKRLKAIESDGLTPAYAVQAYIVADQFYPDGGDEVWVLDHAKLKNVAMAREEGLIRWCENGEEGVHYGSNGTGSNEYSGEDEDFYYVHWKDYKKFDRECYCYKEPNAEPIAPPLSPNFDPETGDIAKDQTQLMDHI